MSCEFQSLRGGASQATASTVEPAADTEITRATPEGARMAKSVILIRVVKLDIIYIRRQEIVFVLTSLASLVKKMKNLTP